jgi:hypothetical protein
MDRELRDLIIRWVNVQENPYTSSIVVSDKTITDNYNEGLIAFGNEGEFRQSLKDFLGVKTWTY